MKLCYKQCGIYMCRVKCEFIRLNKSILPENEFSNQCCCECGLRKNCEYKCNCDEENIIHNRRME